MSDEIKRIDIAEFRRLGFLQEVNRQFFHPLGLALEVVVDDCHHPDVEAGSFPAVRCELCGENGKVESLGGVWDHRDDPEGIVFGEGMIDPSQVAIVEVERKRHMKAREDLLGERRTVQVK